MKKEDIEAKATAEFLLRDKKATTSRARSIMVGTCFGGTTEVSMRGDDGTTLWTPMQPVEVVELIHQLCANVGLHVALKPRNDFASWRDWRHIPEEKSHMNGWAPFVNDMAPFMQVGAAGMDKSVEAMLQAGAKLVESGGGMGGGVLPAFTEVSGVQGGQNETVATQKTVGRKRTKRAATAT